MVLMQLQAQLAQAATVAQEPHIIITEELAAAAVQVQSAARAAPDEMVAQEEQAEQVEYHFRLILLPVQLLFLIIKMLL